MLEELRERAKSLPLPDRARFLRKRDDVERVMAAADVFVLPSTKEGFSNALIEAMASGLAIVATRVGGNDEAVRDRQDGLLIEPLEPDQLLLAGERLLTDAALRRRLARSARERAKEFSLDKMIEKIEALYSMDDPTA
jgi:glycosyltransferase involved in cell wall biosynthesis